VAVENGTSKDKAGKYSFVNKEGRTVVYINPVTMGEARWGSYLADMKARLRKGEVITNLVSCHSSLYVLLFKLSSLSISSFLFCVIPPFLSYKLSSHSSALESWCRILSSLVFEDSTGQP